MPSLTRISIFVMAALSTLSAAAPTVGPRCDACDEAGSGSGVGLGGLVGLGLGLGGPIGAGIGGSVGVGAGGSVGVGAGGSVGAGAGGSVGAGAGGSAGGSGGDDHGDDSGEGSGDDSGDDSGHGDDSGSGDSSSGSGSGSGTSRPLPVICADLQGKVSPLVDQLTALAQAEVNVDALASICGEIKGIFVEAQASVQAFIDAHVGLDVALAADINGSASVGIDAFAGTLSALVNLVFNGCKVVFEAAAEGNADACAKVIGDLCSTIAVFIQLCGTLCGSALLVAVKAQIGGFISFCGTVGVSVAVDFLASVGLGVGAGVGASVGASVEAGLGGLGRLLGGLLGLRVGIKA